MPESAVPAPPRPRPLRPALQESYERRELLPPPPARAVPRSRAALGAAVLLGTLVLALTLLLGWRGMQRIADSGGLLDRAAVEPYFADPAGATGAPPPAATRRGR